MNEVIGKPIDRVDGRLKVTGGAKYSAEFPFKNLAYGTIIQSTISKGHIRSIDTREAEKYPGVLAVITYKNSMSLHQLQGGSSDPGSGKLGERDLLPLQSERIFYDGQHIAIVVAETFEIAEHASTLVRVEYNEEKPLFEIEQALPDSYQPKSGLGGSEVQSKRGDAAKAMQDAEVKVEETYTTPVYHHNPMEPHATIAEWNDGQLTIYDSTQSVVGSKNAIAQMLGIQPEKLRLISLFIGGGFGSKGFTWPHSVMAPMAARHVGRPVKIVLNRMQMFTGNGHRAKLIQKIGLGAAHDGKLNAISHIVTTETSFVDEFVEPAIVSTRILYDTPNLECVTNIVRLNKGTPCPTRAPGEAPGTYALEVALDELAYKLKMDPVQLRIVNYAEKNPHTDQKWSAKYLRECYEQGSDAIGWNKRSAEPASMKEGGLLVGYGMATAIYPANRTGASVKIQMSSNGKVTIYCATQDIGTGTYTVLSQIAADAMGISMENIECRLGDSQFPKGPNSGGSQTSASAGGTVWAAGLTLKSKIINMAIQDKSSPLSGQQEDAIEIENGKLVSKNDRGKGESYAQIISRQGVPFVEAEVTTKVSTKETQQDEGNSAAKSQSQEGGQSSQDKKNPFVKQDEDVDRKQYAFQSFGAHFVKVLVDPLLGTVRVNKVVSVMDIGKVLNLKTAKNQIMGGVIFGMGMALMEETIYDPENGRVVTRDLANYHVPVNADMPEFDIRFIDKPDPYISPVGSRGIGEIGITGITAAIINAIYHATGKRIRDLPATPDKLII